MNSLNRNPDLYTDAERVRVAHLCAKFIIHRFNCPDPGGQLPLHKFIARVLDHCADVAPYCTFPALYLLQRLRSHFGMALPGRTSGHALFLTSFLITMKYGVDDIPDVPFEELAGCPSDVVLSKLELNMLELLGYNANTHPEALADFECRVRRDFSGDGPYPEYVLPVTSLGPVDKSISVVATFNPRNGRIGQAEAVETDTAAPTWSAEDWSKRFCDRKLTQWQV